MSVPSQPWSLDAPSSAEQRDGLVQFWLNAPHDQLEALWNSGFGTVTRRLVKELTPQHVFTPEQVVLRNAIGERFKQSGLNHPVAAQLMLANFLLSPPELLTINNIDQFFPAWLSSAYQELYVNAPTSDNVAQTPKHLSAPPQPHHQPPSPDFGPFPSTLQQLVANRLHLNRLLGLSNLYYIDPDDHEITSELIELRGHFADAIQCCPESQLEQLWATELGERYWALVRSGIQKEPLSTEDESRKQTSVNALNPQAGGGFGVPGSLNAFLIAMMYFLPGKMKVDNAKQKVPAWLLTGYEDIFAKELPA